MNLMSSHIAESRGTNETMYDQLREEILKFLGGDVNMTAEIMALPQEQRVTNIYHYQSPVAFLIVFLLSQVKKVTNISTFKASCFSNCLLTVTRTKGNEHFHYQSQLFSNCLLTVTRTKGNEHFHYQSQLLF